MLGDPLFWIFVLPGLLLGMYAQGRIKANIAKYSQVGTLAPCRFQASDPRVLFRLKTPTSGR
jgi:Zn-dependent membrane protease YugP